MEEQTKQLKEKKACAWKKLLFSETLIDKNKSHKIAYIALVTAIVVVANMFFEIKFAQTQFSFTLVVSALAGIIIGPLFGFASCFLGDLVGFFYHSSGYAYYPWIGIAMGLTATIAGFIVNGLHFNKKWGLYIKLLLVCLGTFLVCTVAINTTAFWLLYAKGVSYFTYLFTRLFVQGQIWNSLVNYALLFLLVPALGKIPALKLQIR